MMFEKEKKNDCLIANKLITDLKGPKACLIANKLITDLKGPKACLIANK